MPIPSSNPALVGLVGLNGNIAPVFRLPELLGYSVDDAQLRWLALCGRQGCVGLAFEAVLGTLAGQDGAICPTQNGQPVQGVLSGMVQTPQGAAKIIDMDKLLARVEQGAKL